MTPGQPDLVGEPVHRMTNGHSAFGISSRRTGSTYEGPPPPLRKLVKAHRASYDDYQELRAAFERAYGKVVKEYYPSYFEAGLLLVRPVELVGRHRPLQIHLVYDSAIAASVSPRLEGALLCAKADEREASLRLYAKPRDYVTETIFDIIEFLLNALDGTVNRSPGQGSDDRIAHAVDVALAQLQRQRKFVAETSRKTSLTEYLVGLPVGIVLVILLVACTPLIRHIAPNLPDPVTWGPYLTEISYFAAVCLVSGAVGATLSVMTRITWGRRLQVDSDQSTLVKVASGAFRPVIGALLGTAIYVLIKGGTLPFAEPSSNREGVFFFVGLAFVAGFSERWAQDTILRSAPRLSGGEPVDLGESQSNPRHQK